MKKIYSILAVTVFAFAGLCSCNEMEEPQQVEKQGLHSAFFDGRVAELVDETGTKGLSIIAMPDWRKTAESHIHLYENGVEGTDPVMTIDPEDNRIAHFTATFGEETEVLPIIAPTKAGASYVYNGIIAPSNEENLFAVPSVQYPDTEISLIDPDADFLIGCSRQSKSPYSETDPINLNFVRPVSLFRLAIVNLGKGEKVQEVAFTTDSPLTGKFALEDVDFESGAVTFDQTDASNTVTLKYDNADPKIIFYAYYVICPANATVKTIVVKTDKCTYTKEYEASAKVNFSCGKFYSIAVDMSDAKTDDDDEREAQTLVFDPSETSFEIGGEIADFEEPVLSGNMTDEITFSSSDESIATVDAESGEVSFLSAGDVVISATAAENEKYKEGTGSYIVHVTKPSSQTLTFTPESASYQIGSGDFVAPVLSGDETDVTYSSSNEAVATVDKLTGEVTIIAAGETVITATAEKTAKFFGAEASYTLTVTAAPVPQTKTWYAASTIEDGIDYIIVSNGKALKNDSGSVAAADVVVSNGTIVLDEDASLVWTSKSVTDTDLLQYGNFQFLSDSKYLSRISAGSSTSKLEIHASTDTEIATKMKYTMWDYDGSYFYNVSIYSSSKSTYYAYFNSSWKIATSGYSTTALYESRQPQEVSFSAASATYDLKDDSFEKPSLNGAAAGATVVYSSDNEAVAVVDASTGAIKGKAKGTATITAKVSSTDDYQGAVASYELTVVNTAPAPASTKFYLVDALAAGEEGLIVSNGYAMQNNGGALSAYKVSPSDDEIEIPGDVIESVVWSVANSEDTSYGAYSIVNDGKFIYVDGSYNSGYSLAFGVDESREKKYFGWGYDSAKSEISNGSSSNKRYLYYSSSSEKFTVSTSSSNSHKVAFYSKNKPEDQPVVPVTGTKYVKVTSAPVSWDGTYLLVDEASNSVFSEKTSSKYSKSGIEINEGTIISNDLSACEVTITAYDASDILQPNDYPTTVVGYKVKTAEGKYLYDYNSTPIQSSYSKTSGGKTVNYYNAFMLDKDGVQMLSTRGTDGSIKYFGNYSGSFKYQEKKENSRISLYKKVVE